MNLSVAEMLLTEQLQRRFAGTHQPHPLLATSFIGEGVAVSNEEDCASNKKATSLTDFGHSAFCNSALT